MFVEEVPLRVIELVQGNLLIGFSAMNCHLRDSWREPRWWTCHTGCCMLVSLLMYACALCNHPLQLLVRCARALLQQTEITAFSHVRHLLTRSPSAPTSSSACGACLRIRIHTGQFRAVTDHSQVVRTNHTLDISTDGTAMAGKLFCALGELQGLMNQSSARAAT
jgi:hypothetical protein